MNVSLGQYRDVLVIFGIWFFVLNAFALFVNNRLNLAPDTAYTWIDPVTFFQVQGESILGLRDNWDSKWYIDIATNGYSYTEGELSNVVFFPLYPVAISALVLLLPMSPVLAGWMISSVFLLLALVLLYRYVQEHHPTINPLEPVVFLLVFPTAFFLNALYTESLFIFLSIASFYFTLKKRYWLAGLCGMLSGVTRITGVLLFVPLLLEVIRNETSIFTRFDMKRLRNIGVHGLPLLLIVLAPIGFFLYQYLLFGDFFLFLKVESTFGRAFALNEDHFLFQSTAASAQFIFDCTIALLSLIVSAVLLFKVRLSYGLYTLSVLLLPIMTGTLMSIGRYMMVAFPLYLYIASLKNPYWKAAYLFLRTNPLSFIPSATAKI